MGGLAFYIFSAGIDAIFFPALEMDSKWCEDWDEYEDTRSDRIIRECIIFKNKVEELKFVYNQEMEKRHNKKIYAMIAVASFITLLLMLLAPHHFFDNGEKFIKHKPELLASAIFYGFVLIVVMQLFYRNILPPPVEWFPEEFQEIRQARIEFILRDIENHAK